MKIKNFKFVDADHSNQSPNKRKGVLPKDIVIVLHYTASGGKTGGGDASYLSRASSRASAQLVIGREGDLHQLMDLNEIAWHAGKSSYNGRSDVNSFSIGIELDNWGWLDDRGIDLPDEEIHRETRNGKHLWEKYSEKQLEMAEKVIESIKNYPKFNVIDIVGHEDVSPGRKQDPGPALSAFMEKIRNKYDFELTKPKTAVNLNLRAYPVLPSTILTTILKGTEVEVLETQTHGWSKVKHGKRIGWVANRYLN